MRAEDQAGRSFSIIPKLPFVAKGIICGSGGQVAFAAGATCHFSPGSILFGSLHVAAAVHALHHVAQRIEQIMPGGIAIRSAAIGYLCAREQAVCAPGVDRGDGWRRAGRLLRLGDHFIAVVDEVGAHAAHLFPRQQPVATIFGAQRGRVNGRGRLSGRPVIRQMVLRIEPHSGHPYTGQGCRWRRSGIPWATEWYHSPRSDCSRCR